MKSIRSYTTCAGLYSRDKEYHNLSTGQVNDAFQQALGRAPTGGELSQYTNNGAFNGGAGQQQLISQLGGKPASSVSNPTSTSVSVPSFNDVVNNAQQLQNFQIQANQPAIQSLGSQSNDLQSRYSDLLNSIKGQGSVAVNAQTLATNNELGKRGISSDSGVGAQTMASALLPVTTQYAGLTAQTGLQEQQDVNSIASQIAQLQAGNSAAAISGATGFLTAQQNAANTNAQIAAQLQTAQLNAQTQQQANAIQDAYNKGQLSNTQASLALQNLELQKVTLPQSQASINASNASAGQNSAQSALEQYQLQSYKNGNSLNLSSGNTIPNYFTPVQTYGPINPNKG